MLYFFRIRNLAREEGQGLAEYVLLFALIALAAAGLIVVLLWGRTI